MTDTLYTHASFWKCALQVNPHSYSASYRGQDHRMSATAYAEALRDVCLNKRIRVIGLADHGNVADAESLRRLLDEAGILVFPGFEVATTEKVHWVCLFPENTSEQKLERYLGKMHLTDPTEGVRPSDLGGQQLLAVVEELGGFCFAAHVTSDNGLLTGKFNNLWIDARLRAAQIPGTVEDLPDKYKAIVLNKNSQYQRVRPITVINAKDVARPEDLADSRASTFIKMTRPCFASFLLAFKDPESRVRLNDDMQEHFYSRIDSVQIQGGYFDGLTAKFSHHLNSVIGGRGTGKSTLLECLRYALGVPYKAQDAKKQGDQIVKENLGKAGGRVIVELHSVVNNMKCYKVIRRYGEPPRVIDDEGNESHLHPDRDLLPGVEIYGQNEIFELARSPGQLSRVLDRFLPEDTKQQYRLDLARRKLTENGEQLTKARERKDEIEVRIAELPKLQERVRQFREQGLEQKLKVVPLLEKERQLEPRMRQEVERVRQAQGRFREELPDLVFLSDKALEGLPHSDLLRKGRRILEKLEITLQQKLDEIGSAVSEAETALALVIEDVEQGMTKSEAQIEKVFANLPAMAGKTGREVGVAYQRLLREIEKIKPTQSRLKTVDDLVCDLEQTRRNLLGEISDIRSARTVAKQTAVKKLNKRLAGMLRIGIVPNGLRQDLHKFLRGLPGIGPKKTKWVDEAQGLTVMGLVAAIRGGRTALLNKGWGLTSGLADALTRLNPSQLHALEAIDLEDRVSIELNLAHSEPARFRALESLSTGQQCTAILHLLLLDNPDPLIVDQPEDNLDNAFIAERIVKELRSAKTERQFLFATHNANIPVFGDAEWIGVCTAAGNHAEMPPEKQGSIDIPEIRDHAAAILEGGQEAFTQRREKYGFD